MKIPSAFRLSLRELFLLVALVATGLAWYREHQIAGPIREAYSNLESDTGTPRMAVSVTNGRYRGLYFEVIAMTPKFVRSNRPSQYLDEIYDSSPQSPPAN